jgi:hypothetical protein
MNYRTNVGKMSQCFLREPLRGNESPPQRRWSRVQSCPTEIKDEIGMASVEIPGELSLERRRECRREDG